jgi:hypothetical protein
MNTCPLDPYAEYRVLPLSMFPPALAMASSRNVFLSACCAVAGKSRFEHTGVPTKILVLTLSLFTKNKMLLTKLCKLSHLLFGSNLQMRWDLPWSRNLSLSLFRLVDPKQQKAHCFQVCLFLHFIT